MVLKKMEWGFLEWGYPNSWMVFKKENPFKMDDEMG
jgi:hypothetical protein